MGILAGHSNTIAALVPGAMSVTLPNGERRTAAVSGGLIKVENNEVLVLADSAERPDEIDAKLGLGIVLLHFSSTASQWAGKIQWGFGADAAKLQLPEGFEAVASCKL